ncbi:hypothetical protein E3P99_03988 [Wallemia hederae]|uniref:Uncharacterized protein n=1 Tax=Wallemia hederae TaxID=1540922 RepID=A0A4T0FBP8_9BASI|nr:hypothetical protein E3P99_03988 [Wallemia hederae]
MFKLLTTMRYTPNGEMQESVYLWHRHLRRLHQGIDALSARSASELDEEAVKKEIERAVEAANGVDKPHRVSVTLDLSSLQATATATPLAAMPDYPVNVVLDVEPTQTDSALLRHKSTQRDIYDASKQRNGTFDALMHNEHGYITETTIANVFYKFKDDVIWYTPPAGDGLLPGLMRAQLLDDGFCKERSLSVSELMDALENNAISMKASNALRGVFDIHTHPQRQ